MSERRHVADGAPVLNVSSPKSSWIGPAMIGAATFLATHLFLVMTWERFFAWMEVHEPWWLNSLSSMIVTGLINCI